MDEPIRFGSFSGRQIQEIIAFLSHCENKGCTDIRFVRQQASNHLHRNVHRMKMTAEERELARERKRLLAGIKPQFMADNKDARDTNVACPKCETGVMREYMDGEGTIWTACVRYSDQGRRSWGCGFSTIERMR